tara:strand:- start:198 stop:386 length:189 start_codon:yes stop_codon:yes gene_type:complete
MRLTKPQLRTLQAKHSQLRPTDQSFLAFRRKAQPTFGLDDGATVIHWCGMWLCVERCGYCHT